MRALATAAEFNIQAIGHEVASTCVAGKIVCRKGRDRS